MKKRLLHTLKKRFGVKGKHVLLFMVPEQTLIARVGLLHFRCPYLRLDTLEVWSGAAWQEVRNLRELGFVLAEAGGFAAPPESELTPVAP